MLERCDVFVESDDFTEHGLWLLKGPLDEWDEHEFADKAQVIPIGTQTLLQCKFVRINRLVVCFLQPISTLVEWDHIEEYLRPYYKDKIYYPSGKPFYLKHLRSPLVMTRPTSLSFSTSQKNLNELRPFFGTSPSPSPLPEEEEEEDELYECIQLDSDMD